jgi:hypothetical protein
MGETSTYTTNTMKMICLGQILRLGVAAYQQSQIRDLCTKRETLHTSLLSKTNEYCYISDQASGMRVE